LKKSLEQRLAHDVAELVTKHGDKATRGEIESTYSYEWHRQNKIHKNNCVDKVRATYVAVDKHYCRLKR